MPCFCAMQVVLSLTAGDRASPWSSGTKAGTGHQEEHCSGPQATVPFQDALQESLEHQGPAKRVEMALAAQAEQMPCESRLGGKQSVSAPHPTALPGRRSGGAPDPGPWQLLRGSALLQRGQLGGEPWS